MIRPRASLAHSFDVDFGEARRIQERLRRRVVESDRFGPVRHVAAADVSYDRGSPILYAAIVVVDVSSGDVIERAGVRRRVRFPYVPGYLSFREVPPLLDVFARLGQRPDLVLCDGQGRAHPRRFGFACHLGVLLDLPTVGCAKSRLVGTHREPASRRGSHVQLRDDGETIGEVVRTRDGVRPVFVSVGHRVSLASARRWVLRLAPHHRLPEPLREAHAEVNRLRRNASARRDRSSARHSFRSSTQRPGEAARAR